MTTKQLYETIRDIIGDMEREETDRTRRFIELNPTHKYTRYIQRDAYMSALLELRFKLHDLRDKL